MLFFLMICGYIFLIIIYLFFFTKESIACDRLGRCDLMCSKCDMPLRGRMQMSDEMGQIRH